MICTDGKRKNVPQDLNGLRKNSGMGRERRTSGAEALISIALYGTAKPVPFVQRLFSIQGLNAGSLAEELRAHLLGSFVWGEGAPQVPRLRSG